MHNYWIELGGVRQGSASRVKAMGCLAIASIGLLAYCDRAHSRQMEAG